MMSGWGVQSPFHETQDGHLGSMKPFSEGEPGSLGIQGTRDLYIPKRWRSPFQPLSSGHENAPSQKGHQQNCQEDKCQCGDQS